MEPTLLPVTNLRVNDYLLILAPHEELAHKITAVKKEFADTYRLVAPEGIKPHVGLVKCSTWATMEDKIIHRLQHIAMGIRPFKIELKDYGSFPTHSIFINITTKLPVQNLVKEVKELQRLLKTSNENKPYFIDEPNIVIARKLKPWQYESGWLEYRHRQFTGRFLADHMLLLKKESTARRYQVLRRFDFLNLPVTTRQGELAF